MMPVGTSAWSGAGILAKPFSDFYLGDTDGTAFSFNNLGTGGTGGPRFAAGSDGSVVVRFHRGTVIPEPEEYALVFGLFCVGVCGCASSAAEETTSGGGCCCVRGLFGVCCGLGVVSSRLGKQARAVITPEKASRFQKFGNGIFFAFEEGMEGKNID